ncbi:MAG: hypothetical protein F4Z82_00130 [Caldilineaceae bacterium SB0668_bin_21]|nr:hypothetical protein [Caldilineaceae bacterium SB0668_bin_21]MYC20368.1 hypothetical protein [Caldilineaceae bacterium SB0662_bin_25]
MAEYRMSIPQREKNILFAKSGNRCAFHNCEMPVIADEGDESKPLAEMAHMIAYADDGPRADPALPKEEKNKASNLILLCPTHHSLVDKFECQYNIHVLREMKLQHERKFSQSPHSSKPPKLVTESLHASILPLSHLPFAVFAAETDYTKANIRSLFDVLNNQTGRRTLYAFELRDKKLYTFHDLRQAGNPFRGTYDQPTVEMLRSTELWDSPDEHRLYVALLNRTLRGFLSIKGVAYDDRHYRYFFLPGEKELKRKFTYRSLSGRRTTKSVVNNPVTRATGQPKSYWVHLAANLSFHQIASRQWVLTIRPERYLTRDGSRPYFHSSIGRTVTRIKSTMYNWQYLQEIQLWREFMTGAKPRQILNFGKQSIVIENNLLKAGIQWLGIPDDQKDFVFQEHPEDLFTSSEIDILDEDEDAFYGELFLEEDEE